MRLETVGIVGYGAFGALLHALLGRFAPDVAVRVHTHGKKPDRKTFFSLAETAKSDVVILAVPSSDYKKLCATLRSFGFDIVEVSSREHDKHIAETLFLTHFLGQVISRGGFERTGVDTVSFGFLMDAVESVRKDGKLFTDVFRFNPYCR